MAGSLHLLAFVCCAAAAASWASCSWWRAGGRWWCRSWAPSCVVMTLDLAEGGRRCFASRSPPCSWAA
eukprot:5260969-Alexandrium_andersonii.AAC.1